MSNAKSSGSQNKQSGEPGSLSEQDQAKQRAGTQEKSSHNAKSRIKAGIGEGAGGGAKQKAKR